MLHSYSSRICIKVDNRCSDCEVAPHDVNHVLHCSKNNTDMKVIELWKRPVEAANWLDLKPTVQHNHTAQNNPPSLPLSPMLTMPLLRPNPRTACHSLWRRCKKVAAPQANCGQALMLLLLRYLFLFSYKCN